MPDVWHGHDWLRPDLTLCSRSITVMYLAAPGSHPVNRVTCPACRDEVARRLGRTIGALECADLHWGWVASCVPGAVLTPVSAERYPVSAEVYIPPITREQVICVLLALRELGPDPASRNMSSGRITEIHAAADRIANTHGPAKMPAAAPAAAPAAPLPLRPSGRDMSDL